MHKPIPALIGACALGAVAALAQAPKYAGLHPKPARPLVAPAEKPMLLITGKPIGAADKQQLASSVLKAHALRAKGAKPVGGAAANGAAAAAFSSGSGQTTAGSAAAKPAALTPDLMFFQGLGSLVGYNAMTDDPANGFLSFSAGPSSNLVACVDVSANQVYTLVFKVWSGNANQGFTVGTLNSAGALDGPQTVTGLANPVTANEIAYAFVASAAGVTKVQLSSAAVWILTSVEISSTPI